MKLDQLERAIVVSCAAVFLLAIADGMEMSQVCSTVGAGNCSRGITDAQPIPAAPMPLAPPSQEEIPVAAEGRVAKITSRLDVSTESLTDAAQH